MSVSVEQAFVHILACVFSVPELTNSLGRTTPIGEVISIEEPNESDVGVLDGADSWGDPDNGGDSCDCLERNGVVSLSVRKPLKREMTASMMPYSISGVSSSIQSTSTSKTLRPWLLTAPLPDSIPPAAPKNFSTVRLSTS